METGLFGTQTGIIFLHDENNFLEGGEAPSDFNHIQKMKYKTNENIFELTIFFSKKPQAP
ncbi:MAG: hypothetical protein HRT68_12825, partial [Flavobacteriaceae bacterium]|nr:hypothetical protein [Flavobacteriaceae bacterium]